MLFYIGIHIPFPKFYQYSDILYNNLMSGDPLWFPLPDGISSNDHPGLSDAEQWKNTEDVLCVYVSHSVVSDCLQPHGL